MKYLDIRHYAYNLARSVTRYTGENHAKRYIYYYGAQILLETIVQLLIFLALGTIFNVLKETLITLLSFVTLRFYAGGYHADTFRKCTIISICIIATCILVSKYINQLYIVSAISFTLLLIYAPLDHKNKPIINPMLRKRFKIISVLIFAFWTILSFYISNKYYANIIAISVFIECLTLIQFKNTSSITAV